MINFLQAELDKYIIHKVGNKLRQEGINISRNTTTVIDESIREVFLRFLLSPFNNNENIYRFHHPTNLELNEVYTYALEIMKDNNLLKEYSVNIARHLYECSVHPKVKSGELYIVLLKNCIVNDKSTDAIGIFKTENKDIYIKVKDDNGVFDVMYDDGINVNNLDKGCIVLNDNSGSGFIVSVVDSIGRSNNEAKYWRDDFLSVVPLQTEQFQTEQYLTIFNQFITKVQSNNGKEEQMRLRSKTLDYFTDREFFNTSDFYDSVIKTPEYIEAFEMFKSNYENSNGVDLEEGFKIAPKTVQKMKRRLRNLIRLDTDVEIRVKKLYPDNYDFIERGFDEDKGMFFYKVYFNQEN
ncbi:nucleoid-associated protein [Tumebacillus flagellatus]|uniref:Nucleoid-associated protein n=1 Tax=Tumebacillus flagellatus TaxID=1157490 RepID=A0A074LQ80_9BACL|nr:nucleoid-associated protein [Tumebacillus flagellatus]KEO82003.1 hypothetical protein EL26_17690 [Tumebacillus flagellatus]